MLRSVLRPIRQVRFNAARQVMDNAIPVIGLTGIAAGAYYCARLFYIDKYYGETAAHHTIREIVENCDDLEIKLDSPLNVFSNRDELAAFYQNNKEPRRSFGPPCEKDFGKKIS